MTTTFADYLLPTATELPKLSTSYREFAVAEQSARREGRGRVRRDRRSTALVSAIENALDAVRRSHRPLPDHAATAH